MGMWLYGKLK